MQFINRREIIDIDIKLRIFFFYLDISHAFFRNFNFKIIPE